jgi:hypothetical protein
LTGGDTALEIGAQCVRRPLQSSLAGIQFHDYYWNIDTIPLHRRALDLTEPGPFVKIACIERCLKPNRAVVFPAREANSVPQNRSTDALKHLRWVDVDGNHRPCRCFTEADNATGPLSYEENASLDGAEVSTGSAIQQSGLDDLCRIMARTESANGCDMQLMKARRVFGRAGRITISDERIGSKCRLTVG